MGGRRALLESSSEEVGFKMQKNSYYHQNKGKIDLIILTFSIAKHTLFLLHFCRKIAGETKRFHAISEGCY